MPERPAPHCRKGPTNPALETLMNTPEKKPLPPWEQNRADFIDAMATAYESTRRDEREATYRQWSERYRQLADAGTFSPPPPPRKKFLGLL